MIKEVKLIQNVKDGEQIIATFQTFLRGDGATPSITTVGGYNTIIGYIFLITHFFYNGMTTIFDFDFMGIV